MPAAARLRHSADFTAVVRGGERIRAGSLVLHVSAAKSAQGTAGCGFVVSKQVGGAVVRNRVKRRLRHLASARLQAFDGRDLVIRALPPAATATSAELAADLDAGLSRWAGSR